MSFQVQIGALRDQTGVISGSYRGYFEVKSGSFTDHFWAFERDFGVISRWNQGHFRTILGAFESHYGGHFGVISGLSMIYEYSCIIGSYPKITPIWSPKSPLTRIYPNLTQKWPWFDPDLTPSPLINTTLSGPENTAIWPRNAPDLNLKWHANCKQSRSYPQFNPIWLHHPSSRSHSEVAPMWAWNSEITCKHSRNDPNLSLKWHSYAPEMTPIWPQIGNFRSITFFRSPNNHFILISNLPRSHMEIEGWARIPDMCECRDHDWVSRFN